MKLVKTSVIALAISAMLAGPVLAQGASSDGKVRGGVQGKSQMQGGAPISDEEELSAQTGAPGAKAGVNAKTRGTVGAGSGAAKGTGGAAGDAATGKRY